MMPYPDQLNALPSNISSIPVEKRHVLFNLIQQHSLHDCLEAGFANGVSSVVIATATTGTLLTFDRPSARNNQPSIEQLISDFNLKNITPKYCSDYVWEFGQLVLQKRQFDFIFIDASHQFTDTVAGIALADQLLKTGGYLVLDDIGWVPNRSMSITYAEMVKRDPLIGEQEWHSAPVNEAFNCLLQKNPHYQCAIEERMMICYKVPTPPIA